MCDLFALSAERSYSAFKSLPVFAVRARKNMDGWGIGFFSKHGAEVEKSAERVYAPDRVHDSFERLARVIRSRIIVAHVRFRTSGPVDVCHAHPFVLPFGSHQWLFAHNGRAPAIESYRSSGPIVDEAVSDSARTFEYLRDHLQRYLLTPPTAADLFRVLQEAILSMLAQYPGEYNFLLCNTQILFAFTNHRQFMVLKRSRELEGALLLTTLEHGLSDEPWTRIARPSNKQGLLLAISGTDIIVQQAL